MFIFLIFVLFHTNQKKKNTQRSSMFENDFFKRIKETGISCSVYLAVEGKEAEDEYDKQFLVDVMIGGGCQIERCKDIIGMVDVMMNYAKTVLNILITISPQRRILYKQGEPVTFHSFNKPVYTIKQNWSTFCYNSF